MGTVYMVISSAIFLVETILQLCVVALYSRNTGSQFMTLLTIAMAPLIFINFMSAILVTRTQDFRGKRCEKALCISFHSMQLGLIWRSLKLLIHFESKEWPDYLNMQLLHCGFQSLPFSVVLAYCMFVNETKHSLDICTILFSLISASVAFNIYRTSEKLYVTENLDSETSNTRKHVGVIFLIFGSFLVLFSRCSSIVLFSLAIPYWIALPLSLHFAVFIFIELYHLKGSDHHAFVKIVNSIYLSFVNIFDISGKNYSGVKCSHVLYYSEMLMENLAFIFYWMLTANFGEMFKLMTVLLTLVCFILGIIIKFASCGCIFNIESDILSDAFNNPELQCELKKETETHLRNAEEVAYQFDATARETNVTVEPIPEAALISEIPNTSFDKYSKHGSSSSSSKVLTCEYDNNAFVKSQGNLSVNSKITSNTPNQSNRNKTCSLDIGSRNNSLGSTRHSLSSKEPSLCISQQTNKRLNRNHNKHFHPKPKVKHEHSVEINTDHHERPVRFSERRVLEKPKIVVSDESRNLNLQQRAPSRGITLTSNADLASANSRYSRNTHTLKGSVRDYKYNGFDDPFRERRCFEANRTKHRMRENHSYSRRHPHSLDYSLESSDLYPSTSSDTSSMTSYTETNEHHWREPRKRILNIQKQIDSRDGYSTDVSNSDYISFTDDSSSCTESSSESDGAATWPPSHTNNLLKMYNIPDKDSSASNIMHWLDNMEMEGSVHDTSFSTLHEPSLASDTDISLSAMQTFEIKKDKKKFRKLFPKGVLLTFRSLSYKGKEKSLQDRPYPLNKGKQTQIQEVKKIDDKHEHAMLRINDLSEGHSVSVPRDSVQESVV